MTQPQVTVTCENPECAWYAKERTVSAQHLGQGVYTLGMLVCECRPTVALATLPTGQP